jgi:hypothetical protein
LRAGVIVEKGQDQDSEKPALRKNESNDAGLVFLRFELIDLSFAANYGIGPIGIGQVPKWTPAFDRRQGREVLVGRR